MAPSWVASTTRTSIWAEDHVGNRCRTGRGRLDELHEQLHRCTQGHRHATPATSTSGRGGPRARTATAGGHPRRIPPVACLAPPHVTGDPVLIAIVVETPALLTDTAIPALTATMTPTALNNTDDDCDAHVVAQAASWLTAAHPRRSAPPSAGAATAHPRSTTPCPRAARPAGPATPGPAGAQDRCRTAEHPHHHHQAASPPTTAHPDAHTPRKPSPPGHATDAPARSAEPDTAATREHAAV